MNEIIQNTEVEVSKKNCPFCEASQETESHSNVNSPIDEHNDVLLKPDLGMLIPGYLLAITKTHHTSFSQLSRERLKVVDERLSLYEDALTERFGRYFRMEHGSDNLLTHGSGGCIEHAHMHLVPADEDVGARIQEQLAWQQLDSFEDLSEFRGQPYIYLGRLAMHHVVIDPKLPGQWVRRQIAAERGLEQWDWALCNSAEELKLTFDGLKNFPLKIFLEGNGE